MEYELVDTSVESGHHHVVLANPDKPNPINDRLQAELDAVVSEVETDEDARVLTVTGAGGAFAVGADIAQMNEWFANDDWEQLIRFLRGGQELMARIDDLDVVTVAGVNGYALGGGLELALACDVRIAAASAEIGFPEVDLGMIPGWGGTQRLPRVVGESTAKDLLVTGRRIDADEALDIGVVDRVVDDDELDGALSDYADRLATKPDHVLPYLLDAVETGTESPLDTGLAYELLCDTFACFDDDTGDRIAEFAEK